MILEFLIYNGDTLSNAWNPAIVGDYVTDLATGRRYAADLVSHLKDTQDIPLFTRVMAAAGELANASHDGVSVGFLSQIGQYLLDA